MAVFAAGLRLSDRYLLDHRVGAGGLWLAHDELLGRSVAVRTAAAREARAAAAVCHPHVTQVLDFGEVDAGPYLVMEYLEGEDLGRRLADGPLPWAEAARTGAEVAGALAAAHAIGVVHGDIRPGTVMLTPAGAKVIGFGLARAGDPASPASDVYALGALLHAALTGPGARSLLEVDGLPPVVRALCERCLADAPEARPSSQEVARVLRSAVRLPVPPVALATTRVRAQAPVRPATVLPEITAVLRARSARWPTRWRAPLAAAASTLLVAGLVLIAVAAFEVRGDASPPATIAAAPAPAVEVRVEAPAQVPAAGAPVAEAPTAQLPVAGAPVAGVPEVPVPVGPVLGPVAVMPADVVAYAPRGWSREQLGRCLAALRSAGVRLTERLTEPQARAAWADWRLRRGWSTWCR